MIIANTQAERKDILWGKGNEEINERKQVFHKKKIYIYIYTHIYIYSMKHKET